MDHPELVRYLVGGLVGTCGFFLAGVYTEVKAVQKETAERLAKTAKELSDRVAGIEQSLAVTKNRLEGLTERVSGNRDELDIGRSRVHYLFQKIHTLGMLAEMAGWKIDAKDWSLRESD